MKLKILRVVKVANLPRELCHHLIGEHHTTAHRMWVGLAVMAGGVFLAKSADMVPHYVGVFVDLTGYGIHALGAAPYIEWLMEEEV